MDINAINSSLNTNNAATSAPASIKVTLVSLGGVQDYDLTSGITVREFKSRNNLTDMKIVTADGTALSDTDTISGDVQLFVSTPKKNG